jgi:hypothetical protein
MNKGASIGVFIMVILAGASAISLSSSIWLYTSDELGPAPSLEYHFGEAPCKGCWVIHKGARYDIFDVRIQQTTLVFMTVSRNGVIELNSDILCKTLSTRLVIQMAHFLKTVTSSANNLGNLVNSLEPAIAAATQLAQLGGQWKVARELNEIRLSFGKMEDLASKLVQVLSISEPQADRLLDEHTYEASEKFIISLLSTGLIFSSNRAARLFFFMTTLATAILGVPSAEWFDTFFDRVAEADSTTLMSLISMTFGTSEATRTTKEVATRR